MRQSQEIFGPDHYFLEMQRHGIDLEEKVAAQLPRLARETGAPIVLTNDSHYLCGDHATAHDVLLCIQTGQDLDDPKRFRFQSNEVWFKDADAMLRLVPDPPGKIVDGKILLRDRDLLALSDDEMRAVRGNDIAMIFQDPMTSLNPVFRVGSQIADTITLHQGKSKAEAWKMAAELLARVGIPDALLGGPVIIRRYQQRAVRAPPIWRSGSA